MYLKPLTYIIQHTLYDIAFIIQCSITLCDIAYIIQHTLYMYDIAFIYSI